METPKPGRRPLIETGEQFRDGTTEELRAERLVAEYLRVWGLRDPHTIAAFSRHWVRTVTESSSTVPSGSVTELYRAVMRRAMGDMRQWLDYLTREVSNNSQEAPSRRGLLAIEVQTLIDQFPTALLEAESLPASFLEQLASAALPVVPACCPTQMPTQSLEAVLSSKYLSRWYWAWNGTWHRLCHGLSRRRDRNNMECDSAASGGG